MPEYNPPHFAVTPRNRYGNPVLQGAPAKIRRRKDRCHAQLLHVALHGFMINGQTLASEFDSDSTRVWAPRICFVVFIL